MVESILIIEDDKLNMKLFSDLLQSHNFNIIQSDGIGLDAVKLATEHSPDLIIMDIHLPETSGVEHTMLLRADDALKAIPVLAVSGCVMKGDEEKILAAGCDGYLAKPINVPQFLAEVRRFLSVGRFRLTANLITGHAEIDAEHEQLVVLMGEFRDLVGAGDDNKISDKTVEISNALASHFKNEEAIMATLGDKGLEAHKKSHAAILRKYDALIESATQNGFKGAFLDEMNAVLVEDMLETDTDIGTYLHEVELPE